MFDSAANREAEAAAAARPRQPQVLTKISQPGLRRLARRGGVTRVSKTSYEEIRHDMRGVMTEVIVTIGIFMEHASSYRSIRAGEARRKTVRVEDVIKAFKKRGNTVMGRPIVRKTNEKRVAYD